MKILKGITFLFLCCQLQAHAKLTEPKVSTEDNKIELGTHVQLALRLWKSDFKLFKMKDYMEPVTSLFSQARNELPMAITGHFNNDGITDIVLMGYSKNKQYIVALISDPKREKYQIYEMKSEKRENPKRLSNKVSGKVYYGLNTYLSRLPSKMFPSQKIDGIQIEIYLSAATKSYVFNGKKIVPFTGTLKR